ncbi:MAG: hypothetical protein NVV59_13605 [Chitinophagaceae bacterium]|nr:hypothetical protein [Chitinophagaceae bacterium]
MVLQFLSESVLVCWLSLLVATLLTYLLLPFVSRVTGAELSINWLMQPAIIIVYLSAPFILGIIAGIYPALFLSSFQPAKTLKSLFTPKRKSVSFRKVLVVSQFGISIILIITTLVVIQQLNFLQKKSLGYDREKLISFNMSVEMANSFEAFRSHIKNESYVVNMSVSSRIPTGRLLDNSGASAPSGDTTVPLSADIKYLVTDYDFADTYGIQMKSGRYFSRDFGADTASFVLNEAAVKVLGWNHENAVGRPLIYGGQRGMVIGVIKDFHFESLHQPISAMIFQYGNSSQAAFGKVSLKLAGGDIASSLASLEQKWKQHFPETPFDYSFIDERYKDLYEAETRQASLFSYFSAIAILIACLGLFGLSAFMISQRKKEIGVRKVLGANVRSIVVLLSIDFLKLVAIAAALAFPIAWFAMNNWLENFAYRVGIAWWIFIAAGVVASFIALITISFLTIRAALSNPVKSLRTE